MMYRCDDVKYGGVGGNAFSANPSFKWSWKIVSGKVYFILSMPAHILRSSGSNQQTLFLGYVHWFLRWEFIHKCFQNERHQGACRSSKSTLYQSREMYFMHLDMRTRGWSWWRNQNLLLLLLWPVWSYEMACDKFYQYNARTQVVLCCAARYRLTSRVVSIPSFLNDDVDDETLDTLIRPCECSTLFALRGYLSRHLWSCLSKSYGDNRITSFECFDMLGYSGTCGGSVTCGASWGWHL